VPSIGFGTVTAPNQAMQRTLRVTRFARPLVPLIAKSLGHRAARKHQTETGNYEMSVAYFIVLDNPDPGFDTFVNGKALARERRLHSVCKSLGLKTLDDFVSVSDDEVADLLGDDVEMPGTFGEQWFAADEGLRLVTVLSSHIKSNPNAVKDTAGCLRDLAEFTAVLERARSIDAKWHLSVDI
jgi:hypothetical protein